MTKEALKRCPLCLHLPCVGKGGETVGTKVESTDCEVFSARVDLPPSASSFVLKTERLVVKDKQESF